MCSVYHEVQRKETQSNSLLRSSLTDQQQTTLATFRGKRAGKVWNRLSGASTTSNPAAVQTWNTRYKDTLAQSNAWVGQSKDEDLKPRILENLDPRYRKAKAEGNEEEAARIKAGYEKIEPWIPVIGSSAEAWENFEQGNYWKGTFNVGMAALEATGIGALRKVGLKGVQLGFQQGTKQLFKKGLLHQGGTQGVAKFGLQFTEHSLQRMSQRGITPKMVQLTIGKGQKFYDPLNKSINYILPNSFGSGKSLLIGTNALTGEIRTVLRSSKNLIKQRMIPIK